MRPIDSAYDRSQGGLITDFLRALRESGREVETHVNGAVTIDGETWTSQEFDRLAHQWDGDDESIDDLFADESL